MSKNDIMVDIEAQETPKVSYENEIQVTPVIKSIPKSKPSVAKPKTLTLGQVIKLKPDATFFDGTPIPFGIIEKTLYYRGKNQYGVVFGTTTTGATAGMVKESDII